MQRNLTVLSVADLSSMWDTTYDVDYTVEWDGIRLIEDPSTYELDVALEHTLSKYRRQNRRLTKILKNQERRALRAWRQRVLDELNQQVLGVESQDLQIM